MIPIRLEASFPKHLHLEAWSTTAIMAVLCSDHWKGKPSDKTSVLQVKLMTEMHSCHRVMLHTPCPQAFDSRVENIEIWARGWHNGMIIDFPKPRSWSHVEFKVATKITRVFKREFHWETGSKNIRGHRWNRDNSTEFIEEAEGRKRI